MKVTVAPRGILQIDDAKIIFRNFAGRGDKYNREGDRNFSWFIDDQELADQLVKDGWNVKIKPPRDEDDIPFMHLPVKVKFNDRGPTVRLISGENCVYLNEGTVGCLDDVDIIKVDMDIRPYDWTMNGKTGRTAYLHGISVEQEVNRFGERYAEEEYPEE